MTRHGNETVRLSHRDWVGMIAMLFTILSAFIWGTVSIERRLTEVTVRQQQLELRIERIEEQIDQNQEVQDGIRR